MNTKPLSHCPGFERFRDLKTFLCRCRHCGAELEIFSDEFDRPHRCRSCHERIELSRCACTGGGIDPSPR